MWTVKPALRWRHKGNDGVSNRQAHDCLLNRLFRRISKKTSTLRVTGLCEGNSPGTGEFPAQMSSNAENVSIWWRHHGTNADALSNWSFSSLEAYENCFKRPRFHPKQIIWKCRLHTRKQWPFSAIFLLIFITCQIVSEALFGGWRTVNTAIVQRAWEGAYSTGIWLMVHTNCHVNCLECYCNISVTT